MTPRPPWGRRRDDPAAHPAGPVRELAEAGRPTGSLPVGRVDFLAVDLETTGLDPRRDHVLAVGWVPVSGGEVLLAGAHEVVVRPPREAELGESVTVHGLTHDALEDAPTLAAVLPALLGALHGRVLVAHHAPVELGFLAQAVRSTYGSPLPVTAVDTLALQQRLLARPHHAVPPAALRLDAARSRFGLPRYRAHRALTDAVAAAELLLAQVAELGARLGHEPTLDDLRPLRPR